jgi:hypothetical protein
MFERFTNAARGAVVGAEEEARSLRHDQIGTEHLLLGLLAEDAGMVARLLDGFGLTFHAARFQLEVLVDPTTSVPEGHIAFGPSAKRALERSMYEAMALGSADVGTKHMLLGLLGVDLDGDREGLAAGVLRRCGVEPDALRPIAVSSSTTDRPPRRQGRTGADTMAHGPATAVAAVDRLVAPDLRAAMERAYALDPGPGRGAARLLVALLDDAGPAGTALVDAGVTPDVVPADPAARPERFAAELVEAACAAWRLASNLGGREAKATTAHLLVVLLSPDPPSVADAVPGAAALRERILASL